MPKDMLQAGLELFGIHCGGPEGGWGAFSGHTRVGMDRFRDIYVFFGARRVLEKTEFYLKN